MKFSLTWSSEPSTRHEVYKTFAQMSDDDDAADHPGVTLVGRWHDIVAGQGVLICESDDLAAVQGWAFNWNGALNIEIRPVLDDDECKAMLKTKLGL